MAVSVNEIKATYPLPVYNFRVEVGPDAVAFSEVSGLSIHYEVTIETEDKKTKEVIVSLDGKTVKEEGDK